MLHIFSTNAIHFRLSEDIGPKSTTGGTACNCCGFWPMPYRNSKISIWTIKGSRMIQQADKHYVDLLDVTERHHAEWLEVTHQRMQFVQEAMREHVEVMLHCTRAMTRLTNLLDRELQNQAQSTIVLQTSAHGNHSTVNPSTSTLCSHVMGKKEEKCWMS